MRYVVRGNDCVYGKSAETKDVASVTKKAATETKLSLDVKRSAQDNPYEPSQKSKKFRLVESREEKEEVQSYVNPPAADESSKKTTEEENVSLGDIMHEANLIGATMTEEGPVSHNFSQSAPVELPVRPLHVTSSVLPAALATVAHSEEWDEQVAINFAMGLPLSDSEVHSADDIRAYDIAVMFDFHDKYEDVDDQERFGEPREGFHSYVYKMVGLNANGEETTASDEEEGDGSGDEFDSDEDEDGDGDDQSEFGDEAIDRASFIGDDDGDEEEEEWDEHDYSEAELDADEGVSLGDEEETEIELEGEDESTHWTLA